MDFFFKETWLAILTAFLAVIAYWAKSTKESLEQNDARIETSLRTDQLAIDVRLKTVENGITDNKIMLTEIKGDIRVLSGEMGAYRKDKHDVENENAGLRGSIVECTEALKAAERVLMLTEKK